jgi:hypothetical protein
MYIGYHYTQLAVYVSVLIRAAKNSTVDSAFSITDKAKENVFSGKSESEFCVCFCRN